MKVILGIFKAFNKVWQKVIFSKGHNKTKSVNELNGDLTYKLKQNRKTFQ